ncbi:predicted protein [Uncinocarpus reesii 1704]|uniref:Uncharacterized protein n=1 Tax=Uncinocarpus reesii (strain UAMH 1704) TaxID=336963 RepID=C4JLG8_UNCRE|nr:uncharacterized protein UREG_03676 [Uncinocarpus reesii 1704]EEP78830.1 predicted protein [Uncinocarpus reesii 1704]
MARLKMCGRPPQAYEQQQKSPIVRIMGLCKRGSNMRPLHEVRPSAQTDRFLLGKGTNRRSSVNKMTSSAKRCCFGSLLPCGIFISMTHSPDPEDTEGKSKRPSVKQAPPRVPRAPHLALERQIEGCCYATGGSSPRISSTSAWSMPIGSVALRHSLRDRMPREEICAKTFSNDARRAACQAGVEGSNRRKQGRVGDTAKIPAPVVTFVLLRFLSCRMVMFASQTVWYQTGIETEQRPSMTSCEHC